MYELARLMRSRSPKVIANSGLGENLDTCEKTVDLRRKGYPRGVPDLVYPYITGK